MRPLLVLFSNLASIGAVAAGFYLCYLQREGWGWFLFVGILLAHGYKFGCKDEAEKDEKG